MPVLADIATYLQTQGVGVYNTAGSTQTIFENSMPNEPDDCIGLFTYGALPPALEWDGEFPSLQVRVRAKTHATAFAKAYEVMTTLHNKGQLTLGGIWYGSIVANASPASLGRDQGRSRHLYVVNFTVTKEVE